MYCNRISIAATCWLTDSADGVESAYTKLLDAISSHGMRKPMDPAHPCHSVLLSLSNSLSPPLSILRVYAFANAAPRGSTREMQASGGLGGWCEDKPETNPGGAEFPGQPPGSAEGGAQHLLLGVVEQLHQALLDALQSAGRRGS